MINEDLFLTKSKEMKEVYEQMRMVADTKSNVLLTGESGTGKSLLAKRIHDLSDRGGMPFVNVNCGAIPENIFESELFGYERGAFTGAFKTKIGKFELANKGTIFLDEIGTISLAAQVSLLHVLQDEVIQRLGGGQDIEIDVRVIAATNVDLKESIANKTFRNDLYFRLNVFPIHIPPLRERQEDIMDISYEILKKLNFKYKKKVKSFDPEIAAFFLAYSWPGNIRELENIIERAFVMEKNNILSKKTLCDILNFDNENTSETKDELNFPNLNLRDARRYALNIFEKKYIQDLLDVAGGDLKVASKISGVSVRQLYKFLSKHNIRKNPPSVLNEEGISIH